MAALQRSRVLALLRSVDRARTNQTKGAAWERVAKYIFSTIPGWSVGSVNRQHVLHQCEVDIAMWNDQVDSGFKSLHDVIFIEAKNVAAAVSAAHVRIFDSKLSQQGLPFGIMFATNGVSGSLQERTAGHGVIAGVLTQGRRIIVITRADVEALRSTRQLVKLIKHKICELTVAGAIA